MLNLFKIILVFLPILIKGNDNYLRYGETKPIKQHQFTLIPGVFVNQFSYGLSFKKFKKEHMFDIATNTIQSRYWNVNINYNFNKYIKISNFYIPMWFKISNSRREIGFEEGYFPHSLKFKIGSGIGKTTHMKKGYGLRTELGIGASLNLTNSEGNVFELPFNYGQYSFDSNYPQQNPPVSIAVKLTVRIMKLTRRKYQKYNHYSEPMLIVD
ncbi:MAG: hypothetical protein ACI8Q1_001799 [Parvicella sp.]|jgi:hypothetical protein